MLMDNVGLGCPRPRMHYDTGEGMLESDWMETDG